MEARAIIDVGGEVNSFGIATAVPWWSFTKTVLAIALLRLSEDRGIDLDVTVPGKRFSPAQLLRHEAGLPDYGALAAYHADVAAGRSPWPIDKLMAAVEADRLRYEPGHGWAYSNIGYWWVGRLIEQASDRPLAEALSDLVFAPAELTTARLATVPADLANVSMGDEPNYHPGWVYHGLAVGTAMDAARLLQLLLQGRLVNERTLSRMRQSRALPQFRNDLYPDPAYGIGLMLRASDPVDHPIGHTGGGPGSEIAVYGRGGITCAVWVSSGTGINPVGEAFRALEDGSNRKITT
ncbi:beta-lactamase family protein [Tianweitania sp. BSSL-BM11]|uniref:Beta-lactamase family protein n=1 Tax=Tianweitania aestuarii TaxID=2814886 RepID=A0ABS5S0Q1_9HYPH|nr:serine hydrolase domain-containing protein [Tianweitania aestuarii]MBS9721497.1 beta-lactamase family protein [Tianweitania aestuarii]